MRAVTCSSLDIVVSRFHCPVGAADPDCDVADQNANGVVDPLGVGFVLSRFGECR
ncbi:MAG: hypothetical protein IH988_11035 [Planctomycetes bacterium]|nr:hypothetical protein [Planctomycetota bacterium]